MNWNWGEYRMVNPRLIVVDHIYQRPQKQDVISWVAANPDPRAFGVPVMFERSNGVLYCADGQQRIQGVLESESPPKEIPVVSFKMNDVISEAHVFFLINVFRKSLSPLEKHTSAVVAAHPAAVGVERVVSSLELSIGRSTGHPKRIGSVSALRSIWDRSGEEVLKDTLVLASSWPDYDSKRFDAFLLRALGNIVSDAHARGKYDRQKFEAALSKTNPSKILRKSEEIHYEAGTTRVKSIEMALRQTNPILMRP